MKATKFIYLCKYMHYIIINNNLRSFFLNLYFLQVRLQNGAAGVCLFTPGRMTDEHWKVLETAIRKDFTK